MIDNIFNDLPLLKDFKDLKEGGHVYSKQYGVGIVCTLYNDEIIVQFSGLRKRVAVYDGVSGVPAKYLKKQTTKIEVLHDGNAMSFKEFKKRNKIEKKKAEIRQALLKIK